MSLSSFTRRSLWRLLTLPMKLGYIALGITLALSISTAYAAWNTTKVAGDSLLSADWNGLVTEISHPQLTDYATCDTNNAGRVRYDSTSYDLEFCDGYNWILAGNGTGPFTCGTSTVDDADANTYNTVQIGTQCWMKENLRVGTMLASGATNPTNNGTVEKWCYDNSSTNCTTDGGLYAWDEAMGYSTTAGAQGICPSGWHIPTDAEQHTLDNYLATGTCDANRNGVWDCDPAGTALKSGGSSGFDAILTGNRNTGGFFNSRGSYTYLWSSSESGASAWLRNLYSGYTTVNRNALAKAYGFSVRCLQD